jgi:hypothetical protein
MGGRRLLRNERQFQMVNDPIDSLIVRNESDGLHHPSAFRAEHPVNLVNFLKNGWSGP